MKNYASYLGSIINRPTLFIHRDFVWLFYVDEKLKLQSKRLDAEAQTQNHTYTFDIHCIFIRAVQFYKEKK